MTLHYNALSDLTGVSLGANGHFIEIAHKPFAGPVRGSQAPFPSSPQRFTPPTGAYGRFGKRALDIVLSSLALALALPVLALLIAALWFEGGKPVFTQNRLGRGGRHFRMLKLRSMEVDAEARLTTHLAADPALRAEWDLTQKLKHDPRITPLGRLLRKTSLDELPQLINVIKGDMSLVGPRPMLPEQLALYRAPSDYLRLRPGLTGLWQVTARNEHSFALRAEIDRRYAQSVSLTRDVKIMAATVGALWRATGY